MPLPPSAAGTRPPRRAASRPPARSRAPRPGRPASSRPVAGSTRRRTSARRGGLPLGSQGERRSCPAWRRLAAYDLLPVQGGSASRSRRRCASLMKLRPGAGRDAPLRTDLPHSCEGARAVVAQSVLGAERLPLRRPRRPRTNAVPQASLADRRGRRGGRVRRRPAHHGHLVALHAEHGVRRAPAQRDGGAVDGEAERPGLAGRSRLAEPRAHECDRTDGQGADWIRVGSADAAPAAEVRAAVGSRRQLGEAAVRELGGAGGAAVEPGGRDRPLPSPVFATFSDTLTTSGARPDAPLNFAPTDWGWSSIRTPHRAVDRDAAEREARQRGAGPGPHREHDRALRVEVGGAHVGAADVPGGVLVITSPWLPEVTTESVSLRRAPRSSGRRRG